jgi:hypothetical protein
VKATIVRHPAMLHQNETDRCLPCPNGGTKHLEILWTRNGTGAPPPNQHTQQTSQPTPVPTPEPMGSLPSMPPAAPGENAGAQLSQIINVLAGFAYLHTAVPGAESITVDASAQDSQNNTDFDPDMLTDKGTATG